MTSRPRLSAPAARPAVSTAVRDIDYVVLKDSAPVGDAVGIYLPYRPSRITIGCASEHPTALVESIAMGSITAPRPTFRPQLPARVVEDKVLSDAQLETLVYAGDAFERDLPGPFLAAEEGSSLAPDDAGQPYRTGFFLADGTGAGKGRQVAALILDQWLRGRRKHVWISKTETLLEDARRDWIAVGGLALDIQHLNQWKLGTPVGAGEGVLFSTYATLRSNRGDKGTRLKQILDWLGDGFDGMIVFDEAHEMAGVAGGEGRFGTKDGSDQGIAGVRLQNLLPRARVLYVSATGASDVNNLAYATRLGLWGTGTAFADRKAFVESLRRGGIAALELIARDLKMQGLYGARALSFAGVEYDILEHKLTPDQIAVYDAYADAWAIIHANLRAALDATRITDRFSKETYNGGAKAAALSIFESTKQRFFGQLLIGMKLPSLIPAMREDLARGDSVVVQLVSTSEAMLNRALAGLGAEERANLDIELSPREFLMDYLTAAFPVRQMKTCVDDTGKTRSEPMSDEDGRPVLSKEALRMRDDMIEQLGALPIVGSALDHIIGHFGTDAVAEVTGRTSNLEEKIDLAKKIEEAASCYEHMRDTAASHYLRETGRSWTPATGNRISLGVTSAIVDGRAFLRARRERIRDANTAQGTPVVFAGGRLTFRSDDDMKAFGDNLLRTLNAVRERVGDMYLVHGSDMKGIERIAASWAEQNGIQQVRFGLDRKLGDRAGFRRNEQMLSLKPRYIIAFQGNGVTERLVIDAKKAGVRVVDRRGPLGTPPAALNAQADSKVA